MLLSLFFDVLSLKTNPTELVLHNNNEDFLFISYVQRHCVREVPVAEIRSEWKKKEFTYWVYGNENHVYCPENPTNCYKGCTIV